MSNKKENKDEKLEEVVEEDLDVNEQGVSNKSLDHKSKFDTNSEFSNFQGVESHHKIKYYTVKSAKDFEDVLEELVGSKYNSVYAEKKRSWKKTGTIGIYKDEADFQKILDELHLALISSLLKEIKSLDMIKKQYYFSKKLETVVKVTYLPEEKYYKTEYILSDVVYVDELIVSRNNKGMFKIKVIKKMVAPFPVEYVSHHGALAKWYLKRGWKRHFNSIKQGVLLG